MKSSKNSPPCSAEVVGHIKKLVEAHSILTEFVEWSVIKSPANIYVSRAKGTKLFEMAYHHIKSKTPTGRDCNKFLLTQLSDELGYLESSAKWLKELDASFNKVLSFIPPDLKSKIDLWVESDSRKAG